MSKGISGGLAHRCGEVCRHVRYDRDENEAPSIAVATALAKHAGEDVTATNVRLYDYIDPEALDAPFRRRHNGADRAGGQVTFTVESATVVVRPDQVHVYESP